MPVSSLIYVALGVVLTAIMAWLNRAQLRAGGFSLLEGIYWLLAASGLIIGWYFNIIYITTYGDQVSWANWTSLLFANPASASGGQDLIIANALIFPIWTVVEARRERMPAGWLYFPVSALTSYAFALAAFLALRERHRRLR